MKNSVWTILKVIPIVGVLGIVGIIGLFIFTALMLDRTREFRAQAELGQPIVRAIEQYHGNMGHLPPSITNLVPKYLTQMPDTSNRQTHKYEGWEYAVATNGSEVTYTLRYYMGRGGVEYIHPNWYGNDEGHRKVILKNR